ncbi:MAG: L-histidine N(alpha)-methyltransferase [Deltaproteobacteria bacterium]
MQYAALSDSRCLTETFHTVLRQQRNIVLQAGSLRNHRADFATSVCAGLSKCPKRLECRFLYDARGSELYEEICVQPEYYPTRTEAAILRRNARTISELTGPCHLIELGSGSSSKTDYLLAAYQGRNRPLCYTPIDISAAALKMAGRAILHKRPGVQVVGIHGTYRDSFALLRCASPLLLIFLGSTIGNFNPKEQQAFWLEIAASLQAGDYFLLGIDLVKDSGILEAAYNDAAGVTAAFTKNYFARINRELGSSLNLEDIEHVAFYNEEQHRIEIYAEFRVPQTLEIVPAGRIFSIEGGERILVEISTKFHLAAMQQTMHDHGLRTVATFTDENEWFALLLLRKGEANFSAGSGK